MRFYIIITLSVLAVTATGQDQNFTLNDFTRWNTNITHVDDDPIASLSFLTRSISISQTNSLRHNFFSAETPVIHKNSGKKLGGIGFHVFEKKAGSSDLLKAYNVGLSLSYNLSISSSQSVSFAIQPNYVNKRTSLENVTTGNQWLESEFRFDPELDIGESIIQNRMSYLTFHSGVTWKHRHTGQGFTHAFISLNAFHLNTPSESFISKTSVPRSYLLNGGALLHHSRDVDINGQLLAAMTQGRSSFSLLFSGKLRFTNSNPYDVLESGALELIAKATHRGTYSLGAVFHQPVFAFGFSYHLRTSRTAYFRNIIEVGITISKLMWRPKTSTIVVGNTEIRKQTRTFNFSPQNQSQATATQSDTEIIQNNIQELSPVKAVQFELNKDFHFSFSKAELTEEAKAYLQDLYDLLQKNPTYSIQVIGHTDNVGKAQVNYKLSAVRARVVSNHLIDLGLDPARIKFSGKGDTEPVAPNDSESNRAKNRRVQFIISIQQ